MDKLTVLPATTTNKTTASFRINSCEDIDMIVDVPSKSIWFEQVANIIECDDEYENIVLAWDEVCQDKIIFDYLNLNMFFLPQYKRAFSWEQLTTRFDVI